MREYIDAFSSKHSEVPEFFAEELSGFRRNLSQSMTAPPIHEEKRHEEKEEHAAAARETNLSPSVTGFFDQLTTALAEAGHPGVRSAQFADLSGFLTEYTNVTGSPPDQRTAEYIVGRVSEGRGVRNVVGFARKITKDVLTTGEGYVAYEPPSAPPPERPAEPLPPPDWELLHLAHGDQVAPAQDVWASVLEALRSQVSRPAFETWLSDSKGAAYVAGRFVVATPNQFIAEMLEHRLHTVIERAVRDVAGEVLTIQYVVEAQGGESCPVCEGAGGSQQLAI